MRDHRKLFIRDVTPGDPARGEVVLTGVGVGAHYASPTWDDRTIRIRGPAALAARDEARRVLEANRLYPIPAPLRAAPLATDYAARIAALEATGATARVLQVHNDTGWGQKDATFLQMLLCDLLPPGSLIYVPDSLWTSPEWMAQLVSAGFRGCRVLIVAPALENAPSAGFPQMSESRELMVALLVVEETLGDVIREAGGVRVPVPGDRLPRRRMQGEGLVQEGVRGEPLLQLRQVRRQVVECGTAREASHAQVVGAKAPRYVPHWAAPPTGACRTAAPRGGHP